MRQLTVGRGERRVLLFGVLVEAGDFAVRMEGALRSLRYLMACSTPAVETSENDRLVAGILGHELVGGLLMSDFLSAFVRFVWYNEWGGWTAKRGAKWGACLGVEEKKRTSSRKW